MKVLAGIVMVLSVVIAAGSVILDAGVVVPRTKHRLFYVTMTAVVIGSFATVWFCWPSQLKP